MAQDTLYFPHDYNPFDDIRFEAFVIKHGAIGYAVFWRIVEMLHSESSHKLESKQYVYESIGGKLKIDTSIVEGIINDCIVNYRLLQSVNGLFWSERVDRNINLLKESREKRSKAGKKGAKVRWKDN